MANTATIEGWKLRLEKLLSRPLKELLVYESHTIMSFPPETNLDVEELDAIRRRFGSFKVSSTSDLDGSGSTSWLEIELPTQQFVYNIDFLQI